MKFQLKRLQDDLGVVMSRRPVVLIHHRRQMPLTTASASSWTAKSYILLISMTLRSPFPSTSRTDTASSLTTFGFQSPMLESSFSVSLKESSPSSRLPVTTLVKKFLHSEDTKNPCSPSLILSTAKNWLHVQAIREYKNQPISTRLHLRHHSCLSLHEECFPFSPHKGRHSSSFWWCCFCSSSSPWRRRRVLFLSFFTSYNLIFRSLDPFLSPMILENKYHRKLIDYCIRALSLFLKRIYLPTLPVFKHSWDALRFLLKTLLLVANILASAFCPFLRFLLISNIFLVVVALLRSPWIYFIPHILHSWHMKLSSVFDFVSVFLCWCILFGWLLE